MPLPIRISKSGIYLQNRKALLTFLLMALSIVSISMTQVTYAKFSQSFIQADSALAVAFDIDIAAPEEISLEQGQGVYEYHFLSEMDIKGLPFTIANNAEVAIVCKPYISGDVTYRIYVAGEAETEFIVEANETVDFWLTLAADGLSTEIVDVEFLIDIQQLDGR